MELSPELASTAVFFIIEEMDEEINVTLLSHAVGGITGGGITGGKLLRVIGGPAGRRSRVYMLGWRFFDSIPFSIYIHQKSGATVGQMGIKMKLGAEKTMIRDIAT
jgi:hypothetical protein